MIIRFGYFLALRDNFVPFTTVFMGTLWSAFGVYEFRGYGMLITIFAVAVIYGCAYGFAALMWICGFEAMTANIRRKILASTEQSESNGGKK